MVYSSRPLLVITGLALCLAGSNRCCGSCSIHGCISSEDACVVSADPHLIHRCSSSPSHFSVGYITWRIDKEENSLIFLNGNCFLVVSLILIIDIILQCYITFISIILLASLSCSPLAMLPPNSVCVLTRCTIT